MHGSPNRLQHEQSPYLLQHAYNPVDWHPWGEEAFARAAREDKPIFLSIGYATCHWCHVMERESFEDAEAARAMNDVFIAIKVDREERPDIDHIYMTVCQMLTGHGGWPLTVLLTPERKPFFAGTYFPKHGRGEQMGVMELVARTKELWTNEQGKIRNSADQLTAGLLSFQERKGTKAEVSDDVLDQAFSELKDMYDSEYGGFGGRPKFPTPQHTLLLLRHSLGAPKSQALHMAAHTLTAMRHGGVYDHVGFGFHRYATDEHWFLPHFEKMLYDQAMLLWAYAEGFQATGNPLFRQTCEEIVSYVSRDLKASDGAFYSAEDADSEGEEGKFYLFTKEELSNLLGHDGSSVWARVYGFSDEGNFYDEAHGTKNGGNISFLKTSTATVADELGMTESALCAALDPLRQKLLDARSLRVRPLLDDKILTDWNGLMIGALARAGRCIDSSQCIVLAEQATKAILGTMRTADGGLLHRRRGAVAGIPGTLEDYAFLCFGLLELYQSTLQYAYLADAVRIMDQLMFRFADSKRGGFFLTDAQAEQLIIRPKDCYDGALPSGNSVAALCLAVLYRLSGSERYKNAFTQTQQAFGRELNSSPMNYNVFMLAIDLISAPASDVVLVGDRTSQQFKDILDVTRQSYAPGLLILYVDGACINEITAFAPHLTAYASVEAGVRAYACRNFSCQLPTEDPAILAKHLGFMQ